ncbi:unnamed protein product, partial [Ectocarpus sp. 12 AP-2014]
AITTAITTPSSTHQSHRAPEHHRCGGLPHPRTVYCTLSLPANSPRGSFIFLSTTAPGAPSYSTKVPGLSSNVSSHTAGSIGVSHQLQYQCRLLCTEHTVKFR